MPSIQKVNLLIHKILEEESAPIPNIQGCIYSENIQTDKCEALYIYSDTSEWL